VLVECGEYPGPPKSAEADNPVICSLLSGFRGPLSSAEEDNGSPWSRRRKYNTNHSKRLPVQQDAEKGGTDGLVGKTALGYRYYLIISAPLGGNH
jgi:hypothetical protein